MIRQIALALFVCGLFCGRAFALDNGKPGSLLVVPAYDNSQGRLTILSVTNTSEQDNTKVKFVYVDGDTCQFSDRVATLTPNDTYSAVVSAHVPSPSQGGFVWMHAVDSNGNAPILHNWLIGACRILDGVNVSVLGIDPFAFRALVPGDVNGNGLLDLDGVEYELSPDQLLVPSFIGSSPGLFSSEVVLLSLSGGTQFNTRADFLIYNDNEEVFSATRTFHCWSRIPTSVISPAFSMSFLNLTNDDANELIGMSSVEMGWFRIRGRVASSSTTSISNPVVLATFIQHVRGSSTSTLPFSVGLNGNGKLYPTSVTGTF